MGIETVVNPPKGSLYIRFGGARAQSVSLAGFRRRWAADKEFQASDPSCTLDFGMLARVLILLAFALAGCGRNPLGRPAHDGASPGRRTSEDTERGAQDGRAPQTSEDGAAERGAQDGPGRQADACVPLTCHEPACFPAYCGVIGDGCGASLDCGGCAPGRYCRAGQCFPVDCPPASCGNGTPFPYCGVIGDGCGGALHCTCPDPAWTCVDRVCNTVASGCTPIRACLTPWGDEYCGGLIGDGCGGALDCRRECSRPGFVCRSNQCVDASDAGQPAGPPPPAPVPLPPTPPPPPCPPPPLPYPAP